MATATASTKLLLFDLASTVQNVPSNYIRPINDPPNPQVEVSDASSNPLIDLDGPRNSEIIQQIGLACQHDGFFQPPNAAAATMPFDKPIISVTLLYDVFKRFDADGDGKISASELGAIWKSLGRAATNDELGKMMREMDSNGDGFVDFYEFALLNTKGVDSEEIITDLKNAFSAYDINGDGLITAEELFKVFKSSGHECTLTECWKMISGADGDGNGKIDFEEFKVMMMTPSRFEHRTQSGTYSWSRKVSLEWICVITNFVLEVPSAVLDQLSSADSAHKAGYLLSAMLLSFAALFICILEPIYKGRKGQFIWRWTRLPWFYNASQNYRPFGSFKAFLDPLVRFIAKES
ncbi:hypothetical protein Patl1_03595 [Pistacia atlantica]|uniref:Uncharacterized protein n=1 Tax=Pistacia atlantica TaxID=434234 RepID=A0ACC1C4R9_9ROSI|nr:hypothetical protein Patl1_03595 [Pistacia atlantica]